MDMMLPEDWLSAFKLVCLIGSKLPFVSPSGLLVAEAGAEEFVGVEMSMGSLSGGPDIWIVGVRMGTVRGANGSSFPCPSPMGVLCGLLSITCAICTRGKGRYVSMVGSKSKIATKGSQRPGKREMSRDLVGEQRPVERRESRRIERAGFD